jgi:PhnB protein
MRKMVKFQPDGWRTVTPRIVTEDPEGLVGFLKQVFEAEGDFRTGLPAQIRIGDSMVMVSGEGQRDAIPVFLYVYVEDTDATYRRAIAADAVSLEEPTDLPYGDRRAMVRDTWGNTWQIATHNEDLSVEEIRARMGRGS